MASEQWHGVHPASVLVNFVPRLWSLARNVWPLALAMLAGGLGNQGFFDALLLVAFFGIGLVSSIVHAATLRYRVVGGRLEIRSGLLDRQARVVPIERIQNVSMVRNVFQRLSGLVEVRIETASGREAEGLLSAISVARAEGLIAALTPGRSEERATEPEAAPLVENTLLDLLWAGAADVRLGAVAVLLGVVVEVFPSYSEQTARVAERLAGGLVGVFTVIALVSGAWLAGILTTVARGYGFRLMNTPRALIAERGLFTRRREELVTGKVQLLTWTEPLLLRMVGLGSLALETAAARERGSGTDRSEVVVPVVDPAQVRTVANALLGPGEVDPTSVELRPAHPRAVRRAVIATTTRWLVFAAIGAALIGPWGALVGAGWPVALWIARKEALRQGYLLTTRLLITRAGYVSRRVHVLLRDKVQSVDVVQGPTLRWLGLARTSVRVAGSRVPLPLLSVSDAQILQAALIAPAVGPRRGELSPAVP